jgi:hypothetical protein
MTTAGCDCTQKDRAGVNAASDVTGCAITGTKGYWERLAQETRLLAGRMDDDIKRALLQVADRYDRLAQIAEKANGATKLSTN